MFVFIQFFLLHRGFAWATASAVCGRSKYRKRNYSGQKASKPWSQTGKRLCWSDLFTQNILDNPAGVQIYLHGFPAEKGKKRGEKVIDGVADCRNNHRKSGKHPNDHIFIKKSDDGHKQLRRPKHGDHDGAEKQGE